MDESSMIERLRVDADRIDTDDTDVDALVGGALRQGRRRRAHRRVGAAVTTGVVALGIAGAVLVGGVTSARTAIPVTGPAGAPTTATATPAATAAATTTPTATATATPVLSSSPKASSQSSGGSSPATTGVVKASPDDVRDVVADLLPGSLAVTASSSARDEGSNGFPWEYSAALTVKDGDGTSYLFAAIGNGSYEDGCMNLKKCESTTLPDGGILWVTSSPAGDKAGLDLTFNYERADGGHISLMERNYAKGNGPVTRAGLPLTGAEGQALVTSPKWDRLFQG